MPKISAALRDLPRRPHALYRFYDRSDVLLYIGITADLPQRMGSHSTGKPWWTAVSRMEVEHFATRAEVLAAERHAIANERPLYNSQHNAMVWATAEAGQAEPSTSNLADINGPWLQANWRKVPAAVRDWVEVPAYNQGQRDLAEEFLSYYNEEERHQHYKRGITQAIADGDELDDEMTSATDDPYLLGRAALAAFSDAFEQSVRFQDAAQQLMQVLPSDLLSTIRTGAEADVQHYMGDDHTEADVNHWLLHCLIRQIREGSVEIRPSSSDRD